MVWHRSGDQICNCTCTCILCLPEYLCKGKTTAFCVNHGFWWPWWGHPLRRSLLKKARAEQSSMHKYKLLKGCIVPKASQMRFPMRMCRMYGQVMRCWQWMFCLSKQSRRHVAR